MPSLFILEDGETYIPGRECDRTPEESAETTLMKENNRSEAAPLYPPTWTGPFALFALPRELRESIYHHYLHRPENVVYCHDQSYYPKTLTDVRSLFLTSRRVHHEAAPVFFQHNRIEFRGIDRESYGKHVGGVLRLFPSIPGYFLQRVANMYRHRMFVDANADIISLDESAAAALVQMLRDAYIFRDFFPKLREYQIIWWNLPNANYSDVALDNMMVGGKSDVQVVQLWLAWMQQAIRDSKVVPPSWVAFDFSHGWRWWNIKKYEKHINEAYRFLLTEYGKAKDEEARLKDSEEAWLRELETDQKRKKKGKKKNLK